MADTIANYTGNGTQTDFVVPFDYLKKSFVRVYLDSSTLLTGGDYGDTGADYYFLDNTTVRLKTAPADGVLVTIRRYTSATERIVSFKDASILKANDLDTSQLQSFHIAEEARDNVKDALLRNDDGNWDAQNTRIVNVADPIDDQDALTLNYYKKDKQSVINLKEETKGYRDETLGFRNEVEGFRDDALEAKTLAKDWAIKTDGKVVENEVEADYSAKYWAQSIKEMGEAALIVSDNIDDVNTVADNIGDVNIVSGDLEGSFKPPQLLDMGRVGTGNTEEIVITGGNIKTVADNITDVQRVGDLIESGQVGTVIDSVETTNQNVIKAKQSEDNAKASETKAKEAETNSKTSETNAKASETLSKDWAIKLDGIVNEEDYSSKYWAQQSKSSADSVSVTVEEITTAVNQGKTDIQQAGELQVSAINTAGTTQTSAVNTAGDTQKGLVDKAGTDAVASINSSKDAVVQAVTTEGTTQISAVQTEGATQLEAVNTAGNTQTEELNTVTQTHLSEIITAGTSQVQAVNTAGTTQVGLVKTEGTKQTGLVTSASEEALTSIDSAGDAQVEAIKTAGTTQTKAVNDAGQSQTQAVNTAGATQVGLVEAAYEEALTSIASKGEEQVASVNSAGQSQLATINDSVQKAKDWAEKTDAPVEGDAYSAKYWAQQASTVGGQSDWAETNNSSPAFIKNKPDLGVYATKTELSSYALKSEISTIYRYKGTVATYDQLPVASQVVGDAYNIATDDKSHGIKAGDNVVWQGEYWDNLSGYVDLSPYLTSEAASGIYLRQDTASTTYATKSALSGYATKTELDGKMNKITDYGRVGT